jgi:hypothetical protein
MAKIKKAQKGDSLSFETAGVRYPKRRVSIDTAGYAGGKKTFKGTTKYVEGLEAGKPKDSPEKNIKFGRRAVKSAMKAIDKGTISKSKTGTTLSKKKIVKKKIVKK